MTPRFLRALLLLGMVLALFQGLSSDSESVSAQPAETLPTVTPNSGYGPGLNAVVIQGPTTPDQAAVTVARNSRMTVTAIWTLRSGAWVYYLPAFPSIGGGLTSFPDRLASAVVVLA